MNNDALSAAIKRMDENPDRTLALDNYAALHFVLTAEPPIAKHVALGRGMTWDDFSLENVLMGGEPTPLAGTGEPARWLSPAGVAALARHLERLDVAGFRERYDAEGLDEYAIPPGHWEEEVPDRLIREFQSLREFFMTAAQGGEGILLWPL